MSQGERFVLGLPLGRWQTNCWVLGDRAEGTAVVVDPGEHGERQVPEMLRQAGVRCVAILLTHGHLDHLWAVPGLARTLDVPVLLHAEDRWLWDDPAAGFAVPPQTLAAQLGGDWHWDPPTERLRTVTDRERLRLAGLDLEVRHNPGHTPGHVTYLGRGMDGAPLLFPLADEDATPEQVLFSGDLLFAGSIGRSDLARGSAADMDRSLVATVLPLDDGVLVLSGHGPSTTVGRERATNPYLRQAAERRR